MLALRSLWLHKLRAFLSVLGIIIGTAAVITLMAFGEGSMRDALEDIERQGAKNIIIRSEKPPEDPSSQRRTFIVSYGLKQEDYERLRLIDSVVKSVPMRYFKQEIRRFHYMHMGRVVGTTADYAKVNKFEMLMGRFLVDADDVTDEGDDTRMRNVCVLGADVAEALFPFENPLGQTVVMNKHNFVVVGVIAERMPTGNIGGSSAAAEEFNSDVYIPLRTCQGRWGEKIFLRQSGSRSGEAVELHQITLEISDREKVLPAGAAVKDLLERTHIKKDWLVTIPLDRLEEAERARDRYKLLLVVIASISLLVGGIGIMNIMLASVTERTREIGIRRALGAKRSDITFQFLVEATAQTTIGGLIGVGAALAIIFGVPWIASHFFQTNLPAQLHVPSIFQGLFVSIGVGVAAGWYPARRAALLDPIEALRHE
ncbi:MAG: ABC transporter permease [Gemmataceae bacterium]|nr:ABC transporter permease [Gemmataceae bacterium]